MKRTKEEIRANAGGLVFELMYAELKRGAEIEDKELKTMQPKIAHFLKLTFPTKIDSAQANRLAQAFIDYEEDNNEKL